MLVDGVWKSCPLISVIEVAVWFSLAVFSKSSIFHDMDSNTFNIVSSLSVESSSEVFFTFCFSDELVVFLSGITLALSTTSQASSHCLLTFSNVIAVPIWASICSSIPNHMCVLLSLIANSVGLSKASNSIKKSV